MKTNLINDILNLALTRKKVSDKFIYLFKGVVFILFLINEERGKKERTRNGSSDTGVAGDDVYPLF